MIDGKNDEKKVIAAGVLIGFLVAGLKGRHSAVKNSSDHLSGSPLALSRADWKQVALRTKDAIGSKNLPTLAAGIAYYSVLAFFPLLAAVVAIAALLITPEQLTALVTAAETYLPADISSVVSSQLQNLVSRRADNLLAAIIAIAIALFGASGASKNLVTGTNVAYEVEESRGWLAQQARGIAWTVAGIVFGFVVLALLAVNHGLLERLGLSPAVIPWLLYGRWIIMLLFAVLGLAVFYRYGPNRHPVGWRWVGGGAVLATGIWLLTTSLFFAYVQNFANYTQSYSLFAGIIALMIWMNLSALIVLLGAEVNYRIETAALRKA